jgi:hypothetical protein
MNNNFFHGIKITIIIFLNFFRLYWGRTENAYDALQNYGLNRQPVFPSKKNLLSKVFGEEKPPFPCNIRRRRVFAGGSFKISF